jgi:hypothetical protein
LQLDGEFPSAIDIYFCTRLIIAAIIFLGIIIAVPPLLRPSLWFGILLRNSLTGFRLKLFLHIIA